MVLGMQHGVKGHMHGVACKPSPWPPAGFFFFFCKARHIGWDIEVCGLCRSCGLVTRVGLCSHGGYTRLRLPAVSCQQPEVGDASE